MSQIGNAIANGYNRFMGAADQLNADKLANRLVEAGHNSGLGRVGGVVAGGIGVVASGGATAVLWEKMSPVETLFQELPQQLAAQQGGALHKAIDIFGGVLEAGAETFVLAHTLNFGLQSVDATVDMLRDTKFRALQLKDYPERPSRIQLDDTRRS